MLEVPVHPIITEGILYIVGSTGSGKTTLARALSEIFEGKVAVVTNFPEEYKDVPTFYDVREAVEYLGKYPAREKKMLIVDDVSDFDPRELHNTSIFIVVTAQEYKEHMKEHAIIFLRPRGGDDIASLPLKRKHKELLDRGAPGFGILRTRDAEVPVYFYV